MNMRVSFDSETLHQSGSGSITAVLFFEFEGDAFPCVGWNDFVVVTLGWWIEVLRELTAPGAAVDLHFMDGPYSIRIVRELANSVSMQFLEHRAGTQVVYCRNDTLTSVRSALRSVATEVVAACEAKGFQGSDLETLKSLLTETYRAS